MYIRNMTADDYEIVNSFMRELHQQHCEARPDFYSSLECPYTVEEYNELIISDKAIAVLATDGKNIAGIGIASVREKSGMVAKRTVFIDAIYVSEAFRSQGIGKIIMMEIECRSLEKNAERIDLMLWSFNEKARMFYEAMGMNEQRCFFEKQL